MEEKSSPSILEFNLDYDGGNILRETVKWSRFLSIVGFVGIGLFILVVLGMGATLMALWSRALPGIEGWAGLILVAVIIMLLIFGLLTFMLFRFSSMVRKGIESQDQALFNQGLKSLKVYFLITGIFTVLGLLFNVLSLGALF